MNSKVLISAIILFQVVTVIFLGNKILQNKKNVLGKQVINTIKKENIIRGNSQLEYFYEPKPYTVEVINEWVPYKGDYTINADALNERFEYQIEKDENVYRIITLGDSFTYGMYVNTEDNWSEKLEDMLNADMQCTSIDKFEVINLGVGGYDIEYAVERFKIRGPKYNPDLVIWFLKEDDIYQINEILFEKEKVYAKEMRESGEFQREVDKGNFYPSWNKAYNEMLVENDKQDILEAQTKFLAEFNDIYIGPLLVITFPPQNSVLENLLSQSFHKRESYHFQSVTNIHADPALYLENDYHPTVEGHKVIANDVFEYLMQEQLISCDLL